MSRMLALISIIGLALCAALLGGAWALGGDDIFHDPRSMEGLKPLIDLATRKEWHWAGGDTLALDAPINLRYEPLSKINGGQPNVTVTGPADAMDHIRFRAGRITSTTAPRARDKGKVEAVVSGVPIRKFVVNGGENLQLGHVDQDELTVHINGAGAVGGDGKVGHLTLFISGPGSANLGALQVGDAQVSILGPGQATLSPHGALALFALGNSQVTLLSRPASFQRRLWGGAVVHTPDGTETTPPVQPTPSTPPRPPKPPTPATAPGAMPVPVEVPLQVQVVVSPVSGAASGGKPTQHVTVNGPQSVNLGHVDQDHLTLTVAGAGSATAEGRVDRLTVELLGTGNANLGHLAARQVTVHLAGEGNVTVAPSEEVKVEIVGSGNVRLATKPDRITRHIIGSGRVIEAP